MKFKPTGKAVSVMQPYMTIKKETTVFLLPLVVFNMPFYIDFKFPSFGMSIVYIGALLTNILFNENIENLG